MKSFIFLYCLIGIVTTTVAQYKPDYLGDQYMHRTFVMPDDYEGPVVSTLIRRTPDPTIKKAILYVHGYNDYFYQKQLGDSAAVHGYNFYAIDLRKYGRSILAHQDTFAVHKLSEYFADIDTALYTMLQEGQQEIVLMAHSTGGLTTPLYLTQTKYKQEIKALVLNSPFFDMNNSKWMKNILIPIVSFIGGYFPNILVEGRALSMYAESLLRQYHGEWNYDTNWKLTYGHPIRSGWIHAIHSGQQKLQEGLSLDLPILVMSSDKSLKDDGKWNNAFLTADIVLNVTDIQKYGEVLGSDVTRVTINNGIHDLILSPLNARNEVYNIIFQFLEINLPSTKKKD
jgi:alpha-beta hydrolase superfamily lysophospholipase